LKKLKCLVVDDEELARSLLINFISRKADLEVVGSFKNPLEAYQFIEAHQVDVIFLDVQMPGQTGIEFLKEYNPSQAIILTTAYPDFAIEGYQLNVIDYLLKPFSFDRFEKAVEKILANQFSSWLETKSDRDFIVIKADHKIIRLPYQSIIYIQSKREYASFVTVNEKILALHSLIKLESELPKNQFIRIHKSYIVAINQVRAIEGNTLYLGEIALPVGNYYKEQVLEAIFHQ
jgi:DNA-binding LytR/AlgR family response regulator